MDSQLKIGAVSYLNTKPLVHGLAERMPAAEIAYDLPSRLADQLDAARLDVALIPSIEFLRHPEYVIVSDACIGCRGPVLSVKLFSRKPLCEVQTLALDEGSRTSAVMVRILLDHLHGVRPQVETLSIGQDLGDARTDAVLLIGDRAIQASDPNYIEAWDLGEVWYTTFGLPFVFAVWAAKPGKYLDDVSYALGSARDDGVVALPMIAERHCRAIGISPEHCLVYLRDHLHFRLDAAALQGLELYRQRALHLELLKNDFPIRIYDCETT